MTEQQQDTTAASEAGKQPLGGRYWRLWAASVTSNLGDGIAGIAYPWLASAVTRNAVLIALIAVALRLPWLVFTLPAGVITDRLDRRKIMVAMDVARFAITIVVAAAVLNAESGLPSPEALASGVDIETNLPLYLVLVLASLLLGFAEVLRDNSAQTILPALVKPEQLETANGRLWGAEMVMNSFVGPPIGSVLLGIGFALPFFVDGGTFFVAAALVFAISGQYLANGNGGAGGAATSNISWRSEIGEGVRWLWHHPILRPLAIILGLLNGLGMMVFATFVLFAQENLDLETGLFTGELRNLGNTLGFESVGAFVFAVLLMGGALGGVLGAALAARVSQRLGSGPSLWVTIVGSGVTSLVIGLSSRWWVVFLMFTLGTSIAVLWNVITVSLRQTIIPDALLGRVNSVYRFFGWGMMPIGSALGGVIVAVAEPLAGRSAALRWPYFVTAISYGLIMFYAAPRLTTDKMETARAEGIAAKEQ